MTRMVQTSTLSADKIAEFFRVEVFTRSEVQMQCFKYNEHLDEKKIVATVRLYAWLEEGLSIAAVSDTGAIQGIALGTVSDFVFSDSRMAHEVLLCTARKASPGVLLRLLRAFKKYAKERKCKFLNIGASAYSDARYAALLQRMGFSLLAQDFVIKI